MPHSPELLLRLTPEQVWGLLDHSLLNLKLQEVSEEMSELHQRDKTEVQWETLQKGNAAFYPVETCRRVVNRADETAQRNLEAVLYVWKVQGYKACPGLYRAIHPRLLTTMFGALSSSLQASLQSEDSRSGRAGRSKPALDHFLAEMTRLSGRWQRRLELLAKETEHQLVNENRLSTRSDPGQLNVGAPAQLRVEISRRPPTFEEFAGRLWYEALRKSANRRVSGQQLNQIADLLDGSEFTSIKEYLEGNFRDKLADFNQKNPRKAIHTWKQLATWKLPAIKLDGGRAMRKVLSRSATKCRQDLSAGATADKI